MAPPASGARRDAYVVGGLRCALLPPLAQGKPLVADLLALVLIASALREDTHKVNIGSQTSNAP